MGERGTYLPTLFSTTSELSRCGKMSHRYFTPKIPSLIATFAFPGGYGRYERYVFYSVHSVRMRERGEARRDKKNGKMRYSRERLDPFSFFFRKAREKEP